MQMVSSCRRCGNPIYAPSMWFGITPPPVTRSCGCFPDAVTVTTRTEITVPSTIDETTEFSVDVTNIRLC